MITSAVVTPRFQPFQEFADVGAESAEIVLNQMSSTLSTNVRKPRPEELGAHFDLDESLRFGLLPIVWDSTAKGETLAAYAQLYLKEEIQAAGEEPAVPCGTLSEISASVLNPTFCFAGHDGTDPFRPEEGDVSKSLARARATGKSRLMLT